MSSKESAFQQKVAQLQAQLDESLKKTSSKEKCFPTLMVVGGVVPFLLLIILFFLKPNFVQRKQGDKYVRDGRKVFYYTVGLTLLIWLGMYLYTSYSGQSVSQVCAR